MKKAASPPPAWRFSTDDLPEKDRFGVLNELFGGMFLCDMKPLEQSSPTPHVKGGGIALPGVVVTAGQGAGMTFVRTSRHTNQRDDVVMSICTAGCAWVSQRGSGFAVDPGEAYVSLGDEPASASIFREEVHQDLSLVLPRVAFAAAGLDADRLLTRSIPRDNDALRVLVAYLHGLAALTDNPPPGLAAAMASHICDLAALAMGATGEAADAAQHGLRAARLEALKSDIAARIGARDLSLEETARRHGISPIYVRKLFESEGTNFTAFVLARRLERARRMLMSRRYAGMTISAIAFECGFGDLSHFNRSFRRRYGATPSDIRAGSRGQQPTAS